MKRTNTFEVVPMSDVDEELLRRVMDASASLWNELTYERRQQFFDGGSVWDRPLPCRVRIDDLYAELLELLGLLPTVGAATAVGAVIVDLWKIHR